MRADGQGPDEDSASDGSAGDVAVQIPSWTPIVSPTVVRRGRSNLPREICRPSATPDWGPILRPDRTAGRRPGQQRTGDGASLRAGRLESGTGPSPGEPGTYRIGRDDRRGHPRTSVGALTIGAAGQENILPSGRVSVGRDNPRRTQPSFTTPSRGHCRGCFERFSATPDDGRRSLSLAGRVARR